MEDTRIIELFWSRSEEALTGVHEKYGKYCFTIARNILHDDDDAEECVNDTYLKAWNAIPPHRPSKLSAFLGKITRELSLDKYRMKCADKRGGNQLALALDELDDCAGAGDSVEQLAESAAVGKRISDFLRQQPRDARRLFVCRYWYVDSVKDIARRFGISESRVKSSLFRTRNKLRRFLESEGIIL